MDEPDGRIRWLMSNVGGDLEAIPPGPSWQRDAACRNHPPDWWFPAKGRSVSAAKAVCAGCPVRDACLSWALDEVDVGPGDPHTTSHRYGVLGGLSPAERTALARQYARQAA